MENSQVYRHLHRLPLCETPKISVNHKAVDMWTTKCYYKYGLQVVVKGGRKRK